MEEEKEESTPLTGTTDEGGETPAVKGGETPVASGLFGSKEEQQALEVLLTKLIEQSVKSGAAAASSSTPGISVPATGMAKKPLSVWATVGLDLNDSSFSKLHSKESSYGDSKPKYDLEETKFEEYKNMLIEKVKRMHAKDTFVGLDDDGNARDVLKEYTLLTAENMEDQRDITWTDPSYFVNQTAMDVFTDNQIKSSCVGAFLYDSLTESAKRQVNAKKSLFYVTDDNGNEYFDGPALFFVIAEIVDPDNHHMVQNVRKQLSSLTVKDFNYSVITMLSEFKVLMDRVHELGGQYPEDDQFLDFWKCVSTHKEKKFAQYVENEKDGYRKLGRKRHSIDYYIRDLGLKETAMRADSQWNVMAPEDAMLLALVNGLTESSDKSQKTKNKKKKTDKTKDSKKDKDDDPKKKRNNIPAWKLVKPKSGEPTKKVVDGKTYYFCTKCREGDGMWALHETHDDSFVSKSKKSDSKKDEKDKHKKVAFSTDTKSDDGPAVQVKKSLLKNAKAYLAQFEDFGKGGTQGS